MSKSNLEYTTKICATCAKEKHTTEFHSHKQRKDGLHPSCKSCKQEYEKSRYDDPEIRKQIRERQSDYSLKKLYGITREQYNQLLDKQNNRCAICDKHEKEFKKRLAVDHNHITGEIRGLLCNYCNRRVIGRHRDGSLLRKMADYVDQGTGWFVPKKKKPIKRRPQKNG